MISNVSDRETATAVRSGGERPAEDHFLVYIVDPDSDLGASVSGFIRGEGYRVDQFSDAVAALEAIQRTPPDILLVDLQMPGISGADLARRALEVDSDVGILFTTSRSDGAGARDALRMGALDYLGKPLEMGALATAIRRASRLLADRRQGRATSAWLRTEVERQAKQIGEVTLGVLTVLVRALETRFEYFGGHSERVAGMAEAIARKLGMTPDETADVRAGALLHDLGMIAVPDRIVQKAEKLTADEYGELQLHCQRGADILVPLGFLDRPARFILEHHERIDGSGYPLGLEGDAISLGGQVVGIAEAWAGIIEDRPFRKGTPVDEAAMVLERQSESRFKPELVDALLATLP